MPVLSFPLSGSLGGPSVPGAPSDPDITPTTNIVAGKIDHITDAISRLPAQFGSKRKIVAMLTAFVRPAAAIEDALYQLMTQRWIDTAYGVQLDTLGDIVGQLRAGLTDNEYRLYLSARIATNKSRGGREDLIRIARLIVNDDTIKISVLSLGQASGIVTLLGGAVTNTCAGIIASFYRDAVAAGANIDLVSSPGDDDNTLTTSGVLFSNGEDAAVFTIACTTTGVGSTDGTTPAGTARTDLATEWPQSGTLIIEPGLVTQQIIAYTSWMPICNGQGIRFTLVAQQTGHGAGAQVCLYGSCGLGDSNDAGQPSIVSYTDVGTTGGRIADVRE